MDTQIDVQKKYIRMFVFPALFFLLAVAIIPIIFALGNSMCKYLLNRPYLGIKFTGLRNFIYLFTDERFLGAFGTTIIYTVVTSLGSILVGFVMAYLIWKMKNGWLKAILSVLWILPVFYRSGHCWSRISIYVSDRPVKLDSSLSWNTVNGFPSRLFS